jgi:hypothetical protein
MDDDYLYDDFNADFGDQWYSIDFVNKRIAYVLGYLNINSNLYKWLNALELSDLSLEELKYLYK